MVFKFWNNPFYLQIGEALFDGFFTVMIFSVPLLTRRKAKHLWQTNRIVSGPMSGEISRSYVKWTHIYGEMRLQWEAILTYREYGDMLLLHISADQSIFLHRSFFKSDDDWQQCKQIIREKFPGKNTTYDP